MPTLPVGISDLVRRYNMENVTFVIVVNQDETETEHAIIDHGNGEYTSMLKSTFDAQQAAMIANE